MKIYWITKLSDKNPFRSTQLGASSGLRNRGHEVTLFFIRHIDEKKKNSSKIKYIPTIDKPFLSGLVFGFILFFYFPFFSKKNNVDVILVDGDQIFSPFFFLFRLLRIPIVWDIRSLPIDRERSILHDISFNLSKLFVDGLTTITPELKTILENKYSLNDKKIGIWTSGVSMEAFSKKNLSEKVDISRKKNQFTLIHHGTYSPTRGIEELIQSIAEINENIRNNIKLLLVGIPHEKISDLKEICSKLDIADLVDIIPPVDFQKIPSYIQSAEVGVIPLPPENEWWQVSVPLKTLEYLVMGKPILVTDIPFHKKIINECECGVITHSGKPKDISKAITYLYENRDRLEKMGEEGRRLIQNKYTWDNVAYDIESFINQILVKD